MKRKILVSIITGLFLLCLALAALSALLNLQLPNHSQVVDRLSTADKARLAEAFRVRHTLGSHVWPGWDQADIPIILYNEAYAFLVGYGNPPDGWVKVPEGSQRGVAWEQVPEDTFEGQAYYRQRLPGGKVTPQNFAVVVGERWAASLQTKEWMSISLVSQLRQDLPAPLVPFFPYQQFISLMIRGSDGYIGLVSHESFHAYAGMCASQRLSQAENANQLYGDRYPWRDTAWQKSWTQELDLLAQAAQAAWGNKSNAQVIELARRFLAHRQERRTAFRLSPDLVRFERQREWEEGLARYAELAIWREAYLNPNYKPHPATAIDPNFSRYAGFEQRWSAEVNQFKYMADDQGDGRFYYSGMAQAILLDRLMSGWKETAMSEGVGSAWLDELLQEAVQQPEL